MKKPVKVLLAFSIIIVVVLLFFVFKGVTNYTVGTDSTEASDSTKVAKEMSYLKDTEKSFIIKEYSSKQNKQIEYIQRFVGESKGYNTWYGSETLLEKENQHGLFYGDVKVLAYPVKKGAEWGNNSFTFKVESVNKTIKTPAGTFKNVAVVRTTETGVEGYSTTYYAKGVGQILRESVDANSNKTIRFELQAIKKK